MHRSPEPRCLRIKQKSPFLRLPAEIRIMIYRFALIRNQPIDLWPHLYHGNVESSSTGDLPKELLENPLKIRHQESLTYVRKKMATGLLGTCRQIYQEAAMFFWAENLFKFSGRSGWQGLLRFLLTIGPAARSRIRRLDVHAPIYMRWPVKDKDGKDLNGRSKNLPKMHMIKIPQENHLDTVAKQRVCAVLEQDRTLEELNFVIPAGFRNGDATEFGGYTEDHTMKTEALERIQTLDFLKKTIIVESGGYLAVKNGPAQILQQGWDLVCLPGSSILEKDNDGILSWDYKKQEVVETRRWTAHGSDWDCLLGVDTLLANVEEDSHHANGGSHVSPKRTKTARRLKAFEGCVSGDAECSSSSSGNDLAKES